MGVSHWFDIACTNDETINAMAMTRVMVGCAVTQMHKQSNELVSTINKPTHYDDPAQQVPSRVLFVNTRYAGQPRGGDAVGLSY
jgi:hypothetical protein